MAFPKTGTTPDTREPMPGDVIVTWALGHCGGCAAGGLAVGVGRVTVGKGPTVANGMGNVGMGVGSSGVGEMAGSGGVGLGMRCITVAADGPPSLWTNGCTACAMTVLRKYTTPITNISAKATDQALYVRLRAASRSSENTAERRSRLAMIAARKYHMATRAHAPYIQLA